MHVFFGQAAFCIKFDDIHIKIDKNLYGKKFCML